MRILDRIITNGHHEDRRAAAVQLMETWRPAPAGTAPDFERNARAGYLGNAAVFACISARLNLFTEVEFAYQDVDTLELTGGPLLLRNPRRLLARMLLDLDLAGNVFILKVGQTGWQRLRPDRTQVVNNGSVVTGYAWWPDGVGVGEPVPLRVDEVVHWWHYPSPSDPFTGATWLTSVAAEVDNDHAMTSHKSQFFRNAATPNMVVKVNGRLPDDAKEALRLRLAERYAGVNNAYRTMLLEGGADIQVVGANFEAMDFARIQDAGETRIASAAGVPPVLVGFNSGLQAATYSNYLHAMRRFADATLRPLWGSATQALAGLVPRRRGARLTYDDRRIPALQQDAKDDAEITQVHANTIGSLIRSGFDPDEIVPAVVNRDLKSLTHTGAIPVSLYNTDEEASPPGDDDDTPES